MKTATRIVATVVYGLVGVGLLVAGAMTLLVNTGLLPDALRDVVLHFSQNNLGMLHIIQEFGTLMIFAGLITFWFIRHYDQSHGFHWAMTTYWALMALIHWFHVGSPSVSVVSGLVNTIPFAGFLIIGVLRLKTERQPIRNEAQSTTGRTVHTASEGTEAVR
ncbi:MAG: hypothetical protein L0241_24175 [Planctomycetia bacterium]|nr:hypothetical protein [Planctomycetia bacterium]